MAKLILASGSPRRAELLHQIGAAFEVQVSEAEELRDAATPRALTCANARAKAEAVARRYPGRAVLGADTVVALDGESRARRRRRARCSARYPGAATR